MSESSFPGFASTIFRRDSLFRVVALVASLLLTSACSSGRREVVKTGTDELTAPTTESARQTSTPISNLQINTRYGLSPWGYSVRQIPELSVIGNAAFYVAPMPQTNPEPALLNVKTRTVDVDALVAMTKILTDAKLNEAEIDYGLPVIPDLSGTALSFTVDGNSFTQYAYGLSYPKAEDTLNAEQIQSRATLREVIAKLTDLERLAPGHVSEEQSYKSPSYEIWGTKHTALKLNETVDQPVESIADWVYPSIDLSRVAGTAPMCIAADADVEAAFASASIMSVYRQGDLLVELTPRILLPGETPCQRKG